MKLLDTVAPLELPERQLHRGQVRTVVEKLARGVYEVEFSDDEGRTYALLLPRESQLMHAALRACSLNWHLAAALSV